ncbi:hypothetical protein QOT17_015574 [Balamuthia mandrillaris]
MEIIFSPQYTARQEPSPESRLLHDTGLIIYDQEQHCYWCTSLPAERTLLAFYYKVPQTPISSTMPAAEHCWKSGWRGSYMVASPTCMFTPWETSLAIQLHSDFQQFSCANFSVPMISRLMSHVTKTFSPRGKNPSLVKALIEGITGLKCKAAISSNGKLEVTGQEYENLLLSQENYVKVICASLSAHLGDDTMCWRLQQHINNFNAFVSSTLATLYSPSTTTATVSPSAFHFTDFSPIVTSFNLLAAFLFSCLL